MLDYLGKTVDVIIDRPMGSKHPEYGSIYPINYGYIANTISGDGKEIDAYILGEFEPLDKYTGVVIAVVHRKNDNEDKLVVAKDFGSYNKEKIMAILEFQERFFESEIIATRTKSNLPKIRPIVLGLARRGEEVLVSEGYDSIKNETYYRFLGGGIEFGEKTQETLKREFKEELDINIEVKDYLCTLENIFTFEKRKGHEIIIVYEIQLSNEDYEKNEFEMIEEYLKGKKAVWINKKEFLDESKILYPKEVLKYL